MTPFLLTGLAVVIYLGLLQRTLDRMRLSDRAALVIIALMLAGTWLPDVKIGLLSINLGSTLVPLGLAVYLIGTADRLQEQVRALAAIAASTIAVLLLTGCCPRNRAQCLSSPCMPMAWLRGLLATWPAGRGVLPFWRECWASCWQIPSSFCGNYPAKRLPDWRRYF